MRLRARLIVAGVLFAALLWGFQAMLLDHALHAFRSVEEDVSYAWFVPLFSALRACDGAPRPGPVARRAVLCVRWMFHDRLPPLERNAAPVAALPANAGSVVADPGCRCDDGRVGYGDRALARRLRLPAPDVSGAGCGRG